jgi:chaperone BCS1
VGGIAAYLREIPSTLWYWTVFHSTMEVTVKDDDAAFHWVKEWFLEQKFMKRVRHVDLDTTVRNERIALMPAPGKYWFWYCDRFFEVCVSPGARVIGPLPPESPGLVAFQSLQVRSPL